MNTERQQELKARPLAGHKKKNLPAAEEGDALSRQEKKARKVAELWTSRLARRGYYEVCNAFLEHARCCLKLQPAHILLLLHLMKFRSLTLKKRREGREAGNTASEFEAGHAYPGKTELARLMDFDPTYIAALARELEEMGLLRRVPRVAEGSRRNRSNEWDVTPMAASRTMPAMASARRITASLSSLIPRATRRRAPNPRIRTAMFPAARMYGRDTSWRRGCTGGMSGWRTGDAADFLGRDSRRFEGNRRRHPSKGQIDVRGWRYNLLETSLR